VDAVGYVQSKGFFVSFMSGNSTRLAVGMVQSLADALAAAGLLIAFVFGVAGGSLLGRATRQNRVPAVLASVAGLLAIAAIASRWGFLHSALAATAFAMGVENATFEQGGQVRIGLTYMTGSVVKLGHALADQLVGVREASWTPPLALWVGFVSGALAGAHAATRVGSDALWLGSGVATSFAVVGRIMRRSLVD
jgi:uncharacterized membrane protein YoaK (UPF0700 family)